ncbi:MAG: cytidylate kinase family protein [Deltaproteobacteria bacterium]|nr:MAG: cytidylate kinase family protein [Deltaproteobacteria bacterium]
MPLITISQSIGSEGLTIARLVADGLGLKLYDDFELQQMALKIGIDAKDIKSLDEKAPGLFDRILYNRPELYLDYMETVIYEVARAGEGVIIGHGSQMLLRNFDCALHVRVQTATQIRIKNIMDQHGVSRPAAEKLLRKIEDRQRGFFRYAFHLDWDDPSLYDVIINTGKMGADTAAGLIINAANSEDIRTCSIYALDVMERLSLEKQIHAALLKNEINVITLNVDVPEKGLAHISGFTSSVDDKDRIEKVIKKVPGITDVKTEVSFISGMI